MNRKFIVLLIALLVAAAFCACGKTDDSAQPTTDPVTTQPNTTLGTVTEPAPGGDEVTEPQPTENGQEPTEVEGTEPSATEDPTEPAPTEKPTEPVEQPKPTDPEPSEPVNTAVTYYDYYYVFTAEQQEAFINSFESIEAFFVWHKAAKEEYESERIPIDGTGPIVLG